MALTSFLLDAFGLTGIVKPVLFFEIFVIYISCSTKQKIKVVGAGNVA